MPSKKNELISVVIPTFREEKNIAKVLNGVNHQLRDYSHEIIVVDDVRSKDKTAQIARGMGARVIYDNVGKGAALIKGLKAAKGDVIIAMDADLSNEPKELKLLIDAIDIGYDICTGSRFIIGGGRVDEGYAGA